MVIETGAEAEGLFCSQRAENADDPSQSKGECRLLATKGKSD